MATHSSTVAWRIPWTEESSGGLLCKESDTTEHIEEEERNSMKVNILNVFTRLLDPKCLHIYQSIRQPDW